MKKKEDDQRKPERELRMTMKEEPRTEEKPRTKWQPLSLRGAHESVATTLLNQQPAYKA